MAGRQTRIPRVNRPVLFPRRKPPATGKENIVMLQQMEAMARSCDICVLATVSGNRPHCSLMAYVTDKNCREIYMVTHSDTRKYGNLKSNPAVSILIDTRMDRERTTTRAMTVEGVWEGVIDEKKRAAARRMILSVHPHLQDFMNDPKAEILCFQIQSFLLLDGLTDAYYETRRSSFSGLPAESPPPGRIGDSSNRHR
jgi:nitroimidazol reductase NimA-like FMN-containing flavoprotein (pyridoxamine 5'-phosphate oxidase superfamily)